MIVRISHLDSSAYVQDEDNKLLLTSVNTELACQDLFEMHCQRERELNKTMQHHKPWLQTDSDDGALQSVIMVFETGCNALIPNGTCKVSQELNKNRR